MSCPDPTPEPGSVADLESQKYLLERRIRDKKNQEYIESGRLAKHVDELALAVNLVSKESSGKTLEELMILCIKKARQTQSDYVDGLWAKR